MFSAERTLPKPIEKEVFEAIPHKKNIAKQFKKDTANVLAAIQAEDAAQLEKKFEAAENVELEGFNISKNMVQFKKSVKKFHTERYVHNFLYNPSFFVTLSDLTNFK